MARRRNKRYNKNYNNGYKKSYNNGNYSNQNNGSQDRDKLMVGTQPYRRRVRWGMAVLILLMSALIIAMTVFYTNNFYSNNVQPWSMTYGWYCPNDSNGGSVYAKNYNALISRENYAFKQGETKTLTVYADLQKAEEIEPNQRLYVKFNVVYYKGEQPVGQSVYYNLPQDLTDDAAVIWSYEEACKNADFVALEADSVKLAVVYDYEGKDISLRQKIVFSNVFVVEYGK